MNVTVTLDGAPIVARALALLEPAVRDEVAAVVQGTAAEAVATARRLVPRASGELASTIRASRTTDGLVAWVQAGYGTLRRRSRGRDALSAPRRRRASADAGPGVYAMVVEFGDARRNRPPQPYLVPAVESVRQQHRQKLAAALDRAVQQGPGAL